MLFVWIFLSVFIFFIIVETATSMWLNSGIEKEGTASKWSFKNIQEKFVKKKAS